MDNGPESAAVREGARWLIAGRLVAFATETVYGLGADAAQHDAVESIYTTKGRPAGHPLIVHVIDAGQARWWAQWAERAERLAHAFWPGPLTMILPRRPEAPAWACGEQATIGLRCPSHPLARELLTAFTALGGHGVAAPSANRFGRISPTRAAHVFDDLSDAVAAGQVLVLDGGPSVVGLESTIIDLSRETAVLLRPGAISVEQLTAALGEPVEVSINVVNPGVVDDSAPKASGTLSAHYAPVKPLSLVDGEALAALLAQARSAGQKVALLAFAPALAQLGVASPKGSDAPELACVETADADPAEYGRDLYAALRRLDLSDADRIVLQAPPRDAPWQAVWDRLLRAAH